MLELNQKTLKTLTQTFWLALGLTTVGLAGWITTKVIERKNSSRTAESGAAIAVPAETPQTQN
ncbi:MAG: hypothetical protein ACK5QT_00875 [Oligoflexia bacterium]|jgi:hypothetical protein